MDKMLKNNNAMTGVSLLLLIAGIYIGYSNMQELKVIHTELDHIKAALHYKLNLDVDEPYGSNHNNNNPAGFPRDAVIASSTTTRKESK